MYYFNLTVKHDQDKVSIYSGEISSDGLSLMNFTQSGNSINMDLEDNVLQKLLTDVKSVVENAEFESTIKAEAVVTESGIVITFPKLQYAIKDWAGNRMFPNKTFDSFEEGWEFIHENVDNSAYDKSGKENDNVYQDIYVVPEK